MKLLLFFFLVLFFSLSVFAAEADFELDTVVIKYILDKGDSIRDEILLLNNGATKEFLIESDSDFVSVLNSEIEIANKESGSFGFVLDTGKKDYGVYVDEIIVSSENTEVKIPVVMEIETFSPIFDVITETSEPVIGTVAGSELVMDLTIRKFKGESTHASLDSFISDMSGNIIFSDSQSLIVDNELKISIELPILEDAQGNYVFYSIVKDINGVSTGVSSVPFSVGSELTTLSPEEKTETINSYFLWIAFATIFALVIAFLAFNHFWSRKLINDGKEWNKRVVDIKKVKFSDTAREIRKLERQKMALEMAYKKRYVKKSSYDLGTKKINEIIRRLKKRL